MRSQIELKLAEWRTKKREPEAQIAPSSACKHRLIEELGGPENCFVEKKSRTLVGIKDEIRQLEKALACLDEAEKPGIDPRRMTEWFETAIGCANPAGRAAHRGNKLLFGKKQTANANRARRQDQKLIELDNAVLAEIKEKQLRPTKGDQFAATIYVAVRQRLNIITKDGWPTPRNIRDRIAAVLNDGRVTGSNRRNCHFRRLS